MDFTISRLAPVAVVALTAGTAAFAQTPAVTDLDRQVNEAFQQVLRNPGNADAGLNYARLLVQDGNYEGGIAAMERLLLDPAAHPAVRLELAVLYYRLGSYAMAESQLTQALDNPALTGAYRTQAEALLRDTRERNQVSQLDGSVMIGLRVQSNPSARSDRDTLLAGGLPVAVPGPLRPRSDTDVQATLRLDHRYDLGTQNEAAIVSSLVAQVVKYSSSSGSQLSLNQTDPYNYALAELTSGIRFKPSAIGAPGLTLRPHLILGGIQSQGHRLLDTYGAGVDVGYVIDERTRIDAGYEYRQFDYATRVDVPNASLLGGPDNLFRVRLSRELSPGSALSGELRSRFHRTDRDFYDYDAYEARVTYAVSYANPFASDGGFWTTSIWGGALQRHYQAADPSVDPSKRRRDTEWRLGVGNTFALTTAWSVLVQLERIETDANLPNYRNKNSSLFGAVNYRF
jgi:tetratricopeptide (TPR) repeat protein